MKDQYEEDLHAAERTWPVTDLPDPNDYIASVVNGKGRFLLIDHTDAHKTVEIKGFATERLARKEAATLDPSHDLTIVRIEGVGTECGHVVSGRLPGEDWREVA